MVIEGNHCQGMQGLIQDFRRRGREPSSWGGGHQHIIFTKFFRKTALNEEMNFAPGGGGRGTGSAPFRSATGMGLQSSETILQSYVSDPGFFRRVGLGRERSNYYFGQLFPKIV